MALKKDREVVDLLVAQHIHIGRTRLQNVLQFPHLDSFCSFFYGDLMLNLYIIGKIHTVFVPVDVVYDTSRRGIIHSKRKWAICIFSLTILVNSDVP